MKKRLLQIATIAALVLMVVGFDTGCASMPKKLNADEKDFYDMASLLMTKKEKKVFLALTSVAEREAFIDDFWLRRDPYPGTDVNEFKEGYLERIAEANHLFREGGKKSGWKTDRGRVYVLLGVPDRRDVYPTGYWYYDPPMEIWYYGTFYMLFIDRYKVGNYLLDPGSGYQLAQINVAQVRLNAGEKLKPEAENQLSFSIQAKKIKKNEVRFELVVPVKSIYFNQDNSKKDISTVLKVNLQIWDEGRTKLIAEGVKEFPLKLKLEEIESLPANVVLTVFQVLSKGKYVVCAEIENSTNKARIKREEIFKL